MNAPRVIIAATHSGAGKSSWTLGLLSAFRDRGIVVQPFKAGPDYIDPGLHTAVSGRVSRNLDTRLMNPSCVRRLFLRNASGVDLSVIEGVMGYCDGSMEERSMGLAAGSTSDLARVLRSPVLLIIDVRGMCDSAAAVAEGFTRHAGGRLIRGFLLNRTGSERHAAAVRRVVEGCTGLPVLGSLPREEALVLPERHLGLVAAAEAEGFTTALANLREAVLRFTDLGAIREIAEYAPRLKDAGCGRLPGERASDSRKPAVRIAVARDAAFSFIYEDNLDMLRALGAEPVFFSPLKDRELPCDIGGAYLCGGYPELHAQALADNASMRASVRSAAESGMPILAECGGYMYLLDEIQSMEGTRTQGAGVFRGCAVMGRGKSALGYCAAKVVADCIIADRGEMLTGHVFHWSTVVGGDERMEPALRLHMSDKPPVPDGMRRASVFASYLHLHFATCPAAARRFVSCCRRFARSRGGIHA